MKTLKGICFIALILLAAGCGKSTKHWKEQMKSPDSAVRLHAVIALQDRVKEADVVVPVLIEALNDEDVFVRRDAAKALGKFGPAVGEAVCPPLVASLSDPEPSVRKAALASLRKIDPDTAAKASVR